MFCLREGKSGDGGLANNGKKQAPGTSCPGKGALVEELSPAAPRHQDGAPSSPSSSSESDFLDNLAHFEASTLVN